MPTRIGGTTAPLSTTATRQVSDLETPAPASASTPASWTAAPPASGDGFQASAAAQAPLPWAARTASALGTFEGRVQTILGHDAMSLARGVTPVRGGDSLTPAQQDAMEEAMKDLFMEMPVGALSPSAAAALADQLQGVDLGGRDINSLSLKDLKDVGRDAARAWARELRDDNPATYYSVLVGLYAGVGHQKGSAGLESLGIKPEIRHKFVGDKLALKLRGQWDPGFKNFELTPTVSSKWDLGNGQRVSGEVTLDRGGIKEGEVRYDLQRPDLNLSANARFDGHGVTSVGGSATYTRDDFRLSASANYDVRDRSVTASGEAAWKLSENADLAVTASHSSNGANYVGVGLRVTF